MSRAAKLTLAGTSLFAVSTIIIVHFQQQAERAAMHAGVLRDMEQQRIKRDRQADFEMQRELEEEYRKVQTVHDGGQIQELDFEEFRKLSERIKDGQEIQIKIL